MISWKPDKIEDFLNWEWSQIEPIFQALQQMHLDASNIESWLEEWSQLSKLLDESLWRLYDATAIDTGDELAEKKFSDFLDEIRPKGKSAEQKLKEKFLASGLEPDGYQVVLRDLKAQAEIFRQENQQLISEEKKLVVEFDKIIGSQIVTWDGKQTPLPQIQPVFEEQDRARRERAWRLVASRQLDDRQALNQLWLKFLELRQSIAVNSGLQSYRAYRWRELLRFDYSPEDCYKFHQAIEKIVVPKAVEFYEKRRQRLGLPRLRPWDLAVDTYQNGALKPFQTTRELMEKAENIFSKVDTQFGKYFSQMQGEGLLDLENRANKGPGGYCSYYRFSQEPFIFMNAVGVHDDVQTLLHEGGHAFQLFECGHRPYLFLEIPSEFAEVASMAMELLASPYLEEERGGYYSPGEAARARIQYLESMVLFWPYMAVVDAFQHWVYENQQEALDPDNCDACWAGLWSRFMPGVDWSGLSQEMMTGWQRKPHIFDEPFYYIEYGLAQLGAIQVWRNSMDDRAGAVEAYRKALSLGTSVTVPGLYSAAGARFDFDEQTLQEAVDTISRSISEQEKLIS